MRIAGGTNARHCLDDQAPHFLRRVRSEQPRAALGGHALWAEGREIVDQFKAELELVEVAGDTFDLERVLAGQLTPVFFGSAMNNFGVQRFLERFIEIAPSPYHGLNFCQGTVAEMLANPGQEIYDVIRYFGSRGKIFNVHFRNIKGGFLNFQETFPDDGDVDMLRALRVYKEVGYEGMIMPDHVPQIAGDSGGAQAFAFAFGYIQALIQMVESER